ncbi:MAG: NusG domain II-containing protein [Lachnospiraceae bacterium]|nr:NusG domain II-containing protein [Lachnospiraceae bacterium]
MNRRDGILITILLLTAGILYMIFSYADGQDADRVVVTLDGELYGVYPLSENKVFTVETDRGYNVIVIEDKQVYIKEADCPDGYCMKQGKIRTGQESLVCLPHRLVVEVESTSETEGQEKLDAVTH